jgi:hypothetical protein
VGAFGGGRVEAYFIYDTVQNFMKSSIDKKNIYRNESPAKRDEGVNALNFRKV